MDFVGTFFRQILLSQPRLAWWYLSKQTTTNKTRIMKDKIEFIVLLATLCVTSTSCMVPNGGQRGYPPQQQMMAPEMGPAASSGGVRVGVGAFVPSTYFKNQPTSPTAGCVEMPYSQAFGPGGYWANDFRGGKAQIQRVPEGEIVVFDQVQGWAWRKGCHNRVKPVETRRGQPQPMPQPRMMQQPPQQRRSNWGGLSSLINIRLDLQPGMAMRQPQMRCPPPQQQIRMCPQPQQLWCPPQQRGYGYQPYPQPYPPRYY